MTLKKTLKIASVVIVLLVAVVSVGLYALLDSMCQNTVLSDIPSPDEKYRAITFQRDCGATTGFSTQVSVIRPWWYLRNTTGNLFIADTDHGKAPSGSGGGPEVQVSWLSPSVLSIAYHPHARVFRSESVQGSVSVSYKTLEESASNNSLKADVPDGPRP